MKSTRTIVAALISVTRTETIINLVTDILHVEETQSWRGSVIQDLLEGTRKFYEPKDIDITIITDILKESKNFENQKLVNGSVKVLNVFNTQNEIRICYKLEGEEWELTTNISIDDYLKAKEHA